MMTSTGGTSLREIFDRLPMPTQNGSKNLFAATIIPSYQQYRLGKDASGNPAFLISLGSISDQFTTPPIRLQHLCITHNIDCNIHHSDGTIESGQFTVVSCIDADHLMISYFLNVLSALIRILGEKPNRHDINAAFEQLAELFQALKNTAKKTTQGLWAELFIISEANNPTRLIEAWHRIPEDLYDFNTDVHRVEVKSASGQIRKHHFSLAQLLPPADSTLVVASLFVNRAGKGSTVDDLVKELSFKIAAKPELILHLYRVITLTLGDNWHTSSTEAFDRRAARQSLAYFDKTQIPIPNPILPLGVSNVHFTADLTGKAPLTRDMIQELDGLISALPWD